MGLCVNREALASVDAAPGLLADPGIGRIAATVAADGLGWCGQLTHPGMAWLGWAAHVAIIDQLSTHHTARELIGHVGHVHPHFATTDAAGVGVGASAVTSLSCCTHFPNTA